MRTTRTGPPDRNKTGAGSRGRFAPSPTGPLHIGSLVAATGSYLSARSQGGEWVVRIEHVDEPRSVPGAADDILYTLEAFGFEWDGEVVYQSSRKDAYHDALASLRLQTLAFPCTCSRKSVGDAPYRGTCRDRVQSARQKSAWRVKVTDQLIYFRDRILGPQQERLSDTTGDFVVKRADGYFAYQLAVVVDDELQGVTEVVRGADLLDSTARQIYLAELLGYRRQSYAHLPVVVNEAGEKLSKQTGAPGLDVDRAPEELTQALKYLGMNPPLELAALDDLWDWALSVSWPGRPVP